MELTAVTASSGSHANLQWNNFFKSTAAQQLLTNTNEIRIRDLIAIVKREDGSIKIPMPERATFCEQLISTVYPGQFQVIEDRLGKLIIRTNGKLIIRTSDQSADTTVGPDGSDGELSDENVDSEGSVSSDDAAAMSCDEGKTILTKEKKQARARIMMKRESASITALQDHLACVMQSLQTCNGNAEPAEPKARKRPFLLSADHPETTCDRKHRRLLDQEVRLSNQASCMRAMFQEVSSVVVQNPSAAVELLLRQAETIADNKIKMQQLAKDRQESEKVAQLAINQKVETLMRLAGSSP